MPVPEVDDAVGDAKQPGVEVPFVAGGVDRVLHLGEFQEGGATGRGLAPGGPVHTLRASGGVLDFEGAGLAPPDGVEGQALDLARELGTPPDSVKLEPAARAMVVAHIVLVEECERLSVPGLGVFEGVLGGAVARCGGHDGMDVPVGPGRLSWGRGGPLYLDGLDDGEDLVGAHALPGVLACDTEEHVVLHAGLDDLGEDQRAFALRGVPLLGGAAPQHHLHGIQVDGLEGVALTSALDREESGRPVAAQLAGLVVELHPLGEGPRPNTL